MGSPAYYKDSEEYKTLLRTLLLKYSPWSYVDTDGTALSLDWVQKDRDPVLSVISTYPSRIGHGFVRHINPIDVPLEKLVELGNVAKKLIEEEKKCQREK